MQNVSTNGIFDARQYEPNQGGSKHPVGMFPFVIKNTQIVSSKDEKSGMFRVTFESPSGSIDKNYNLWFPENKQTEEIAHKQLSALCHVTGIFQLNMANQGRELVGARGTMEVGWQKNNEPTTDNPSGGYVEIKKVFDAAGNEPGKAQSSAQQPQNQTGWNNQQPQQQPQQAPMQQQAGGGWGQPQQQSPWTQNQQPQQQTPPWGQK